MHLPDLQRRAAQFVATNATSLLTAGGVAGTAVTAVLTAKATFKAAYIIAAEEEHDGELDGLEEYRTRKKIALVWKCYVPPVIVGSATIGSIVMAHRMSLQRAAALAAAYGIAEGRLEEYKGKVSEKLTGAKKQTIDDEIMQDRINKNPPSKEVVILASGDVLCFDAYTGRYFQSTVEAVKRAESELNQKLFDTGMASLSEFYEDLGLPPTQVSDAVGWDGLVDGAIELQISTMMAPNNKPCIAVDFSRMPKVNYQKLYD